MEQRAKVITQVWLSGSTGDIWLAGLLHVGGRLEGGDRISLLPSGCSSLLVACGNLRSRTTCVHSTCGDATSITLRGLVGVTDPPNPACATGSPRGIWVLMGAGSQATATSITATQQPKPNAHPHGPLCGLWVLSLGAGCWSTEQERSSIH